MGKTTRSRLDVWASMSLVWYSSVRSDINDYGILIIVYLCNNFFSGVILTYISKPELLSNRGTIDQRVRKFMVIVQVSHPFGMNIRLDSR